DGTPAGTVQVSNNPSGLSISSAVTPVGNDLFFSGFDSHNYQLWVSDGTTSGTLRLTNVAGPNGLYITSMAELNGRLFFGADDGAGIELWKSDGTASGTVMVTKISPISNWYGVPLDLTNVNGELFFFAPDLLHKMQLWKSDGTSAGTVRATDINAAS